MPADTILFFPLNRKEMGSGHLRRCWKAACELGTRASLVLDDKSSGGIPSSEWTDEIEGFPGEVPIIEMESDACSGIAFMKGADSSAFSPASHRAKTIVVFDRRSTDEKELEVWADIATPVLLDDTGKAGRTAPFLIDSIPGNREREANVFDIGLLDLPTRRRNPDGTGPVLVSFGGHDPAKLTIPAVKSLLSLNGFTPSDISVTLPSGLSEKDLPDGVISLGKLKNLKEQLGNYGLVVCSYGLTAWEALAAGCAVLISDPTPYHESLSREFGFPTLNRFLEDSVLSVKEACRGVEQDADRIAERICVSRDGNSLEETGVSGALAAFLGTLEAPVPCCAACGNPFPPVIARFPTRTYYRCPHCGMTGLYRFRTKPDEYGPAYFDREYRDQYGRTYLEDFDKIKTMAVPRLRAIRKRARAGGTLLDIGCAFGPFLDASREEGFQPHGMDVSEEGIAYVRDTLGIAAARGSFPLDNPAEIFGMGGFDVVTLWYVIEHFSNLHKVLETASSLVKSSGVLAFSTPNGAGISGRRDFRRFLEDGPEDHYTVWTPKTARKLLARHGFRVYRIRVTGHHPERFFLSPKKGSFLFRIIGVISRLFRLGDTFEVYAVKEN